MAEPRVFTSADELREAIGQELGTSDWLEIDQKRIDLFAEATGDHQWIHVDPARAAEGPFGTTIAHGYLTLSLLPALVPQIMRVEGMRMGVNYGVNKVRFPSPCPSAPGCAPARRWPTSRRPPTEACRSPRR